MSTPAPTANSALKKEDTSPLILQLAERYGMAPKTMIDTVIATVFPDGKATIPQLMMFLQVAAQYKLNPFTKEIYAFPSKGGGVIPIVPIDGWANIVNSHPQYDGVEFVDELAEGKIVSTTCIIYRKDRGHPTKVTEYHDECKRDTEPWKKWPKRMLRHKALIQCARVAFSLAGIYDPDEADRIAEGDIDQRPEVTRPQRVVEGVVVQEAKPASTPEPPQDGGGAATSQEEARVEDNRSSVPSESPSSPTADEVGFKPDQSTKPAGPYASKQRVQKLCAVARAAGISVTDNHEDALHKMLLEKHNISSLNEIPETLYDEVLKAAGGEALKIK